MKKILLASLLLGSAVYANMKPQGTYVPQRCSEKKAGVVVCYGTKVGYAGQEFISIDENSVHNVYQVVESEPMNAGINPEFFAAKLTLLGDEGVVREVTEYGSNGEVTTVILTTLAGESVTVDNFDFVMTTM
jgi:hypothetical protein